ncbi:MAG: CDP-alcohol phosphatidyltransferase family protein [Anaerolinea sp.]|nr:CDP-alcohol phosphatidyltransferase family protein [Anaerolinea sp.]
MPFSILPQRMPQQVADAIGRTVGGLGVTPNMISLFGFGGNLLAAYLITQEQLLAAGLVYLVFSALDMVDGAVARAMGLVSKFGAVFDAVLDRASEALVIAACAWYFVDRGEQVQAGVAYAGLFGSVAVSYMRARAEVNGLSMREGLFRRQERVALLSLGLLFNGLTVVIWAMAALSNFTALQRFVLITRRLRTMDSEARQATPGGPPQSSGPR